MPTIERKNDPVIIEGCPNRHTFQMSKIEGTGPVQQWLICPHCGAKFLAHLLTAVEPLRALRC
jgi:hypothetical protein